MEYKVGMYGGAFDPLHVGHLDVLTQSAALCEELYVVLSWSKKRDRFPVSVRYRWLKEATKHLPHVRLLLLEDRKATKENYSMDDWTAGAQQVREMIGKKIDIVFCGSDHEPSKIYEQMYPEAEVRYFERITVPFSFEMPMIYPPFDGKEGDLEDTLSSTGIMENLYTYWDCLAEPVRPYLVKKVLIVGTESTGKTTLAKSLARIFRTNCVEEYGRYVCDRAGGEAFMLTDDFQEIILMQALDIRNACKTANRVVFVDTDALTTAYYAKTLGIPGHEKIDALASAVNDIFRWDLVLYLEPDVPFVQDGTRNDDVERNRESYNRRLRKEFESRGIPIISLTGDYLDRLKQGKEWVDRMLDTPIPRLYDRHPETYYRGCGRYGLDDLGWSRVFHPAGKGGKKHEQK